MKRTARLLGIAGFVLLLAGGAAAMVYAFGQIFSTNAMLVVAAAFAVATLSSVALTWSDL